jgi:TonB family protein
VNGTKRAHSLATWTASQCPFAIEYIPQVLEDIRMAVVRALHGLPHGGLEIGGILLGSHSVDRVTITDFRPLECEHAFGPSFQLSANDHTRLSAAIVDAQATGQTVVGWFHSHTRTAVYLSVADQEIHNRYFQNPREVALVLKPILLKPTLCGFFFREADGTIHSEQSYQEFELEIRTSNDGQARVGRPEPEGYVMPVPAAPRSRRRPQQGEEELPQTSPAFTAALSQTGVQSNREGVPVLPDADLSQPRESPWRAAQPRKSGGRRSPWAWTLVAAVIALILGAAYAMLSRSKQGAPATVQQQASVQLPAADQRLGLKIQRQGADLVLTWDRNALSMQGATAGLLSIKDGPTQKQMGLNAEQLRSATILLSPENDHVEIQLTVLLPNQRTASESGIVVLPAHKSTDPVAFRPTMPLRTYTVAQIKSEAPKVKASQSFLAPPLRNQAPSAPLMDQPPALKGVEPVARIQSSALSAIRPPPGSPSAAPAAEPKRTEAPAPASSATALPVLATGQTLPGLTSTSGLSTPLRVGGNAQPAELVSRREPIYPYAARTAHIQDVVVLEGLVGMDGRVKELKVISGLQTFRKAAVDAVSRWVYKPAMLNGKTIEGHVRVEIRFHEGM